MGLLVLALIGAVAGGTYSYIHQKLEIADGARRPQDFSWGEVFESAAIGAVLLPAAVKIPVVGAVLVALGLSQSVVEFSQGEWRTGSLDLVASVIGLRGIGKTGLRATRGMISRQGQSVIDLFRTVRGKGGPKVNVETARSGRMEQMELPYEPRAEAGPRQMELGYEERVRGGAAAAEAVTETATDHTRQLRLRFEGVENPEQLRFNFDGAAKGGAREVGGLRRSPLIELADEDIARLTKEFGEVGGDPSMLRFNRGKQTGFIDEANKINVRGDVLPVEGAVHPRSAMSSRSALAHELGHARYRGTSLKHGAWNDEFRASYWAAKNARGLTQQERVHLIQDAITRAQDSGVPIRMNKFMRRMLYGIE